ncbi:MAG: hypothetical protein EBU01_15365 [Crocinitomicaceae bacterium]|nr:hypothetical protein [Crocinitomicaceae bacterium]
MPYVFVVRLFELFFLNVKFLFFPVSFIITNEYSFYVSKKLANSILWIQFFKILFDVFGFGIICKLGNIFSSSH